MAHFSSNFVKPHRLFRHTARIKGSVPNFETQLLNRFRLFSKSTNLIFGPGKILALRVEPKQANSKTKRRSYQPEGCYAVYCGA